MADAPVEGAARAGRGARLARLTIGAIGLAAITVGLVLAVVEVPSGSRFAVATWLVGGLVVHDAVLAPAALVLGVVVLDRVPAGWRPALRAGLLGVGSLGFLLVCLVVATGLRRNPTVLPLDPVVGMLGALALLSTLVLLTAVWTVDRRRHRGSGRLE